MFKVSSLCRGAVEPVVKVAQKGATLILTLNRPDKLNAMNPEVIDTLMSNLFKYDADPSVSVFIITGEGRAFSGGVDVKVMSDYKFAHVVSNPRGSHPLRDVNKISKPIILAANGLTYGGGCELAQAVDMIIASEKAKFCQPEINIGTLPGLGGTQNLTRAVGKTRAMEWNLTGLPFSAEEAEEAGLVSRVVKHEELMPTALKIAEAIAKNSQVTVKLAKRAVNASQETTLSMGLAYERDVFAMTFATADRKEGMTAFVEKRAPNFKNE